MDLITGFCAGIALCYLVKHLQKKHNEKLKAGEEEHCKNCCYKSAVMETISDVEKDVEKDI